MVEPQTTELHSIKTPAHRLAYACGRRVQGHAYCPPRVYACICMNVPTTLSEGPETGSGRGQSYAFGPRSCKGDALALPTPPIKSNHARKFSRALD